MKKADDIGEISIEQDRIDWKITQFSIWPNFKKDTAIRSPLFHFAGGERYFSAYLTAEEGSVILSGMSITRCSGDRHDFHCIIFGIIEDSNKIYILVTSRDAHGGMANDYMLKYRRKEIIKFGANLHLFCSWKAVESITDKLSDHLLTVLQLKDEKTMCNDVATQQDMKRAAFRLKDEKARCKNVATQKDIESVADIGNLCQNFKNLLLNGEDHDLILKVNNKEFRVHQCILRIRSPVLDSMLSHDMIEKKSGIIDIPDCDPGAFEQFLLYLYSGEVERLDEGNMLALYSIADEYDVGHLKKQCREFIMNSLTYINVSDVIEHALDHTDGILLKSATDYFLKHASAVLRTVEWQSFAARNIIQANELYIKAGHSLKARKK